MNEKDLERILDNINGCENQCTGLGGQKTIVIEADDLMSNLPGAEYVLSRMINYIFSNGMTAGNDGEQDRRLEAWLYDQQNGLGATNYSTLQCAIKNAIAYGACGLRVIDGNLWLVEKDYYGILTYKHDGIKEIVAYFVDADGKKVEKEVDTSQWEEWEGYEDVLQWFDDNNYILLSDEEFANIRNDTSQLYGYSPLTRDKQRLELILSVYKRLNYDIVYDGPGRIILHTKDGYASDDKNEISTTELLNNAPNMVDGRFDKAKEEARRIAKDIKDSTSDAVAVMSGAFDKEITHLPRVTKATEFLEWLNVDTTIVAQVLGMSPTLLEVGDIHGNVSVEKIIDNAMLNTIIPLREQYAIQFSALIAKQVGATKVFFNKYDMIQIRDENEIRKEIADIIKSLSYSYKAVETPEVGEAIKDVTKLLETSLYDDEGNLITI